MSIIANKCKNECNDTHKHKASIAPEMKETKLRTFFFCRKAGPGISLSFLPPTDGIFSAGKARFSGINCNSGLLPRRRRKCFLPSGSKVKSVHPGEGTSQLGQIVVIPRKYYVLWALSIIFTHSCLGWDASKL